MDLLIAIPIACLLGLIPAKIAKNKGRNFGLWWLYGTCLFIIAFIHSLLLIDDENKNVTKITGQKEIQQYSTNLPIVITNYSFTNKENKLYLNVTFGNMSTKNVSSVKMDIYGFNSFGESIIIDASNHFQLLSQDMQLEPKITKTFMINTPLPSIDIRKVKIVPKNVLMEDGTIYNAKIVHFNIEKIFSENDQNKFIPQQNDKYWLCSCGYINPIENDKCQYCALSKETVFNTDILKKCIIKRENLELNTTNKKVKTKNKINTKKITIVSIITIIILFLGIMFFQNKQDLFYKDKEMYDFINEINHILDLNKLDLEIYLSDDNSKLLNQPILGYNDIKLYKYEDEMIAVSILNQTTDDDFLNIVNRVYAFNNENKKISTVNNNVNIIPITLKKYNIDLYVSFNQLNQLKLIFGRAN